MARLAGVPDEVISRAKEIAGQLEQSDIALRTKSISSGKRDGEEPVQLTLFESMGISSVEIRESPVVEELKKADLSNMTPIQALNFLYDLQGKCK